MAVIALGCLEFFHGSTDVALMECDALGDFCLRSDEGRYRWLNNFLAQESRVYSLARRPAVDRVVDFILIAVV